MLAVGVCAASWPALERAAARRALHPRLRAAAGAGPVVPSMAAGREGGGLASWQTVGGCGAGASSGTGAGVKWIGRNVTGGLFHVECQGSYVHTVNGYNYVATTLVTRDLGERFNLGVNVPYVYKFYGDDPYGKDFDVVNKGLGDVNLLLTRRFGAINDNVATLAVGAPTGTYRAALPSYPDVVLPQDQQLGAGKVTASLMLDHLIDHLWGATVLGGLVSWRGGENDLHNYRAPTATAYWYSSYLLGPFAPALGVSVTGAREHDRDLTQGEQMSPLFSAAANASVEWSNASVAVLLGATLPYQYDGFDRDANGKPRTPWGWGPWVVGVGVALSPF